MEPTITYVDEKEIFPNFGVCNFYTDGRREIKIVKNLPSCVIDYLIGHEKEGHAFDSDYTREGLLEREIEADWAGFKRNPIGWAVMWYLTLTSWSRIKFIFQRIAQ